MGFFYNIQESVEPKRKKLGQCSSLEAHWLLVLEDRVSNLGGEKSFPLSSLSCDLMIAV